MPAWSPQQLVIAAAVQHTLCLQIQHWCRWHQIYAAQQAEYEDSSSSSGSSSDHGSNLSNSSSSSSSSSSGSYSQASSSSLSIGSQDIFMEVCCRQDNGSQYKLPMESSLETQHLP